MLIQFEFYGTCWKLSVAKKRDNHKSTCCVSINGMMFITKKHFHVLKEELCYIKFKFHRGFFLNYVKTFIDSGKIGCQGDIIDHFQTINFLLLSHFCAILSFHTFSICVFVRFCHATTKSHFEFLVNAKKNRRCNLIRHYFLTKVTLTKFCSRK